VSIVAWLTREFKASAIDSAGRKLDGIAAGGCIEGSLEVAIGLNRIHLARGRSVGERALYEDARQFRRSVKITLPGGRWRCR
jgi:hypothetical protein